MLCQVSIKIGHGWPHSIRDMETPYHTCCEWGYILEVSWGTDLKIGSQFKRQVYFYFELECNASWPWCLKNPTAHKHVHEVNEFRITRNIISQFQYYLYSILFVLCISSQQCSAGGSLYIKGLALALELPCTSRPWPCPGGTMHLLALALEVQLHCTSWPSAHNYTVWFWKYARDNCVVP